VTRPVVRERVRFPIRFGRLRLLLTVLGMTRSRSYVDVGPDLVVVRAGVWFSATVPRASIRSAAPSPARPWSIGIHGWGSRWIVNGAAAPMARLTIEPPAAARTLVLRLRLRELEVSVDDPAALVEALGVDS
jgi:hypothetical protein